MAHSLSTQKRARQATKKKVINRARKSVVKTELKKYDDAVKGGDKSKAAEQFKAAVQKLDKVAATSTMHKNKASRLKSRMAKKLNELKD